MRSFIPAKMKFLLTGFLISVLLISCSQTTDGAGNENEADNRPDAPGFTSTTFDNTTFNLDDYTGKVVYIFFLGSSCSLCVAAGPTTNDIYEKYDSQDVQVIGLDVWDGTSEQVSTFITLTGIKYPVGMNASQIGKSFGVIRDYSVIIDKKGRIAFKEEHVVMHTITAKIDALLKEY